MDFNYTSYQKLVSSLQKAGYSFSPFIEYCKKKVPPKTIILRHDVDNLPQNSLNMAKFEFEKGIKGTYYFRIVASSFDKSIINKISEMGHEIGYHYEDMDIIYSKSKNKSRLRLGNNMDLILDKAFTSFCENLEKIRSISSVKTICAHGSPLSPFDNKIIWEKYNYRERGIIGEPYLDVDWSKMAYFTDTGRCWNGSDYNVRDKVISKYHFNFKSTFDIIDNIDQLPSLFMLNIHPERWNDNMLYWLKELVEQKVKNVIKKYFFVNNYKRVITKL